MSDRSSRLLELLAELGRRRVFRTAALYAGLAIVAVELTDSMVDPLGLPLRTLPLVAWAAILGFPIAVGLAWTFDVTPRGIVRTPPESELERYRRIFTTRTGFRLTLTGLAAAAVGATTWTVLEPFLPGEARVVAPAPDMPRGSVLVAPVGLDGGLDAAVAEEAAMLLHQRLSEEPGLRPVDPRRVAEVEMDGSHLVAEARDLGAERLLEVRLAAAPERGDDGIVLTASLATVSGGEPVSVVLPGTVSELEVLVDRLVTELSGSQGIGAEPPTDTTTRRASAG